MGEPSLNELVHLLRRRDVPAFKGLGREMLYDLVEGVTLDPPRYSELDIHRRRTAQVLAFGIGNMQPFGCDGKCFICPDVVTLACLYDAGKIVEHVLYVHRRELMRTKEQLELQLTETDLRRILKDEYQVPRSATLMATKDVLVERILTLQAAAGATGATAEPASGGNTAPTDTAEAPEPTAAAPSPAVAAATSKLAGLRNRINKATGGTPASAASVTPTQAAPATPVTPAATTQAAPAAAQATPAVAPAQEAAPVAAPTTEKKKGGKAPSSLEEALRAFVLSVVPEKAGAPAVDERVTELMITAAELKSGLAGLEKAGTDTLEQLKALAGALSEELNELSEGLSVERTNLGMATAVTLFLANMILCEEGTEPFADLKAVMGKFELTP